jgi:hypothetical protein
MLHLSPTPTLRFFGGRTKRERISSFLVIYREQRKVFLRTINFILENILKFHSLHFKYDLVLYQNANTVKRMARAYINSTCENSAVLKNVHSTKQMKLY